MLPKDVAKYARMMRKVGISHLVVEGCHITLNVSYEPLQHTKESITEPVKEEQPLDDEAILYWSAQGNG